MIYFFADDHYGTHPGKVLYEHLPAELKSRICFQENDWSVLESGSWRKDCELLILNLIATTCNLPHPGPGAEKSGPGMVRERRKCSDASRFQRRLLAVGLVEKNCRVPLGPAERPDGVAPSTHPKKPYTLTFSKSRHPLTKLLEGIELPADEIYINMEQVCPAMTLMETTIEEGTFPQCTEALSPWNGKLVNFIPGHIPEVTSNPKLVRNVATIIEYLRKGN